MPTTTPIHPSTHNSGGGHLVCADGRHLPLCGAELACTAGGGIARSILRQRFTNPFEETLSVNYKLPLPSDGAVSAFRFRYGETTIEGEIDRRESARERFEEALVKGHSAALLEEDRSNTFAQEIANIPAGETIECEITVDQPLAWRGDGSWEYRFPTTLAPRYQGQAGRVPDADRLEVPINTGDSPARLSLSLLVEDGASVDSPSHQIHTIGEGTGCRASFQSEDGVPLDRDLVVRWQVAAPRVGLELRSGRGAAGELASRAFGLLTLVPPLENSKALRRELVLLIDTSGSMNGQPLQQAKRVLTELIGSLEDDDQLEMIEFSVQARRWQKRPVSIDARTRRSAQDWVKSLRAGGGTEMHGAVLEALRPLQVESQRQIVLVTDGYIGFEREIVSAIITELPTSSRVHTVGVGSSVNRSLTGATARAGRGVEVIVGIDEEPETAARTIVARSAAPTVVDLELCGTALLDHAPRFLPDLFGGAPALISVELAPEGGELELRGRTVEGAWKQRLTVAPISATETGAELATRFGRERVEDLETELSGGAELSSIDSRIESLGLTFQIATRLTSWVAISDRATVDPTEPSRREEMPHLLPHGTSIEGLGLRSAPSVDSGMFLSALSAEPCSPVSQSLRMGRSRPSKAGDLRADETGIFEMPCEEEEVDIALVAHLRSARKGSFAFEIESPGIDWRRPARVTLRFADGSEIEFRVKKLWSTRSGFVEAGLFIRLSVGSGEAKCSGQPVQLRWSDGGATHIVNVV
jgi:Ca-activated chloride channel homolog